MRLIKFNQEQYLADYKAAHRRYERWAYRQFKSALDQQVAPVVRYVKSYGGISPELASMMVRPQPMQDAYKSVYTKIGPLHAQFTLTRINRMAKKSWFSRAWAELMATFFENESSTRITQVDETTRERIRQVLADSQDLPISQRADYIVATLDDPDFNRSRALMIARTESTTAANQGAYLGSEDADYLTAKQWLAVEDLATRPTHREADGQVVGVDELFTVGSSECRYPGEIGLPAAETVNCRCTAVYIPLLSDTGLPILK